MSILSRLFGSSSTGRSSKDVDAQLRRLEKEAEEAAPGYVGSAYNRAGDIALREGRSDSAVGYYGRAIDAFLEDAQREAARGVANKILRVRPDTLRTLCTLTWLDLAAKHEATALLHLRDYVEKAAERDEQARAATQIYQMARICPLEEFVGAVADSLDGLNYPNRAGEVRSWVTGGPPDIIADSDDLADACLQAAIQSNERTEDLLDDAMDGEDQATGDEAEPEGAEAADADEAPEDGQTQEDDPIDADASDDGAGSADDGASADEVESPAASDGESDDGADADGGAEAPGSGSSGAKQSRNKRKKKKGRGRGRG